MDIRRGTGIELIAVGHLTAQLQATPESYIAYLGEEAETIVEDIAGVDDWESLLVTSWTDDGLTGWLLPEVDWDMGRIWWWGPFVSAGNWDEVADRLYLDARSSLERVAEEELVADTRSASIPRFAARHGFHREEGSSILRTAAGAEFQIHRHVIPLEAAHWDEVAALHDSLFPGTHTPGRVLVSDPDRSIYVVLTNGGIGGYVAVEGQNDGSLYIDFLGVRANLRRRGLGQALVESACAIELAGRGSYAHLTVRESNTSARALYRSLGFVEERVVVPFRKGFTLA